MQKKINDKTSELEVIIAAKKENWKNTQVEVKNDLIKNLSIKGFRKGKVPSQIAQKYIAQAEVMSKSVEKIVRSIAKEAYESIDKDTIVLSTPSYIVNKISDAELELKFVYPIFPKFEIGNYKNLDIKFNQKKVEQKEINGEIEKMLSNQTILKDKKGAVENGDVAIIDYEGFVDGKAFEGGKAEKHHLKIGSKQFIPGFEEQLIGLQANSEKEIEVTFPQNYNSEELKGKKAKFKILIHNVKIEEKPELNDEFAKTSGVPNVKTIAELKSYIKKVLEKRNYQQAMTDFQKKAFEIIAKTSKGLVVAPALVQNEADSLKNNMKEDLKKQGLEYKNYVEAVGISEKELDSNFVKQAKARLIDAFIFAEIAKQEKVIINEEDYNNRYEELAKVYGQSVPEIKKMITKEQMQIPLTNERVVELLIKNANKINSTK